jgi:Flp pilus assembly protein TadD
MTGNPGVDRIGDAIQLAGAYFDTGNHERGREVLRRSLSQHPNDPSLLAHLARAEYLLDNYPSAATSAYAALSAAPHDELAMRIYALSLAGVGRLYDALWMAWRGVTAHPNEPLQHRVYARLLQQSRQLPSALLAVDESLRLDPASPDALVLRGSILHDLGRMSESTASYRQALSLDASHAAALHNMAVNRMQRGNFRRAVRGFLGAAGSDPTLGDLVRMNIGAVLANILTRATILAVVLGLLVAFVGSVHSNGQPTLTLQVVTGLDTGVLIAILGWLVRAIPRRVLASALRDRVVVAARIVHALLAVGVGAWATAFGEGAWMIPIGVLLIISGVILLRVGLITGM